MLKSSNKKIIVTGGGGFLGSRLIETLRKDHIENIHSVRSNDWDLTKESHVEARYAEVKPIVVFHLAGLVGGIGANRTPPGRFSYDNLMMGTLTVHLATKSDVKKIVSADAGCGYSEFIVMPQYSTEADFWAEFPQPDIAPYLPVERMLRRPAFRLLERARIPLDRHGPEKCLRPLWSPPWCGNSSRPWTRATRGPKSGRRESTDSRS